jgi:predicted RNA-binding Zn-ribbon protein involved in translation (DUF1610 family)
MNTVSVIPVVENKGPIRIGIDTDVLIETPLTNMLKGSVMTHNGQKITRLKIIIQKNVYGKTSLNNKQIDSLWKEKIEELVSYKDQFLFLENQIGEDGNFIKFDSVFLCTRKKLFFTPNCPACGNQLELCKNDLLLKNHNYKPYSDGCERYLICHHCSLKGREPKLYSFDEIDEMIFNLKNLTSEYVEQWSTIPNSEFAIVKFLKESVNGVGDHLANIIVDEFGIDTIKILREDPDRLSENYRIGALRIKKIKSALKTAFKKKVRINRGSIKTSFPCFNCGDKKICFKSRKSINSIIEPIALYPFSMIVYKDDMVSGKEYLSSIHDQNKLNVLLQKCAFLKSVFISLKNSCMAQLDPEEFIEKIEVKRTKKDPFVLYPGLLEKSYGGLNIKFFVSLWFLIFLFNENNHPKIKSLLALISDYSVDRESIVKSHMIDLATPLDQEKGINLWKYIVTNGLEFLNNPNTKIEDFFETINTIEERIDSLISEVDKKALQINKADLNRKKEVDGMKLSFLKIEEVYVRSLEAIIKDIVKEFNPDNGLNGNGVSGFLKKIKGHDEFNDKFRKFKNWYESGSYMKRFMGEVEKNFDSIEE